jgi:hypothetical protein
MKGSRQQKSSSFVLIECGIAATMAGTCNWMKPIAE